MCVWVGESVSGWVGGSVRACVRVCVHCYCWVFSLYLSGF